MVIEKVHVEPATTEEQNTQSATETTETVSTETTTAPITTESTAPSFDWLAKHNIKGEEDFTAILNKNTQLQTELEKAKTQPPVSPYKTEFAKVADELSAKGVKPETIARFHGLKVDELDSKQAYLTRLEIEMPTLSQTERLAYVEEKFGIPDETDSILTAGEKAFKKVELEKEGASARDFLKQYVYEALNPNQVDPSLVEKETGRQNYWKGEGVGKINFQNEVKMPATIKLPGQTGVEEKPFDFVYQIPEEGKQALIKEFSDTLLNPAFGSFFDQTEQGSANANDTYNKMFWQKFGPDIAKKQMEHAATRESQIHEHYAKLMNNTSFRGLNIETNADKSVSADKGMAGFIRKTR